MSQPKQESELASLDTIAALLRVLKQHKGIPEPQAAPRVWLDRLGASEARAGRFADTVSLSFEFDVHCALSSPKEGRSMAIIGSLMKTDMVTVKPDDEHVIS